MKNPTQEQIEWAEKTAKNALNLAPLSASFSTKVKALATALAEREADGWNYNMEDAPRDGERILLLGKTIHPCIDIGHVFWTEAYWEKMNGGGWVYYGAVAEWVAFKRITLPPAKETE